MERLSVVAVVVTYNRKAMLLQALAGLKAQTHKLSAIVLIDNASTDGTPELLREHRLLDDEQIKYVRSPVNTGGAGGFHDGVAKAMQAGADWIWLMDDDVVPSPDCLATMLKYRDVSECIHPRKYYPDGSEFQSERFYDILTCTNYAVDNLSFKNGKKIIFTNTATFEGLLVSRRIVDKIGLPDEKYFICCDDMLFAVKASVHTSISHVADAVLNRLTENADFPAWKQYYFVRNRFYLYRDSCEYLGIQPGLSQKVRFVLIQALDTARIAFKGFSHAKSAFRGFVDGLKYLRKPRAQSAAAPVGTHAEGALS